MRGAIVAGLKAFRKELSLNSSENINKRIERKFTYEDIAIWHSKIEETSAKCSTIGSIVYEDVLKQELQKARSEKEETEKKLQNWYFPGQVGSLFVGVPALTWVFAYGLTYKYGGFPHGTLFASMSTVYAIVGFAQYDVRKDNFIRGATDVHCLTVLATKTKESAQRRANIKRSSYLH